MDSNKYNKGCFAFQMSLQTSFSTRHFANTLSVKKCGKRKLQSLRSKDLFFLILWVYTNSYCLVTLQRPQKTSYISYK